MFFPEAADKTYLVREFDETAAATLDVPDPDRPRHSRLFRIAATR